MFKLFKRRTTKTTTMHDPVVCSIAVYNKAIRSPIAQYNIKKSERHLVGMLKAQYPTHTYRVDVVNY